MGWWAFVGLLAFWAWQDGQAQLWLLPLLAWAYYELCAVPTLCGVETARGHPCKKAAWGRLMACRAEPSHAVYKTDALLRLIGFRRPPRQIAAPAPSGGSRSRAYSEPPPPADATVDSKQTLMIFLTIVATVAGVIQTVFTALG